MGVFVAIANDATGMAGKRLRRMVLVAMLCMCVFSLAPAAYVAGAELGGYVSEKLIGMTGSADSNVVVGGSSNSLLDIIRGIEGMQESDPAYQLNNLIPLIMISLLVFVLFKMIAGGESGTFAIIIVAIGIFVFYAFFPGIREGITNLLWREVP